MPRVLLVTQPTDGGVFRHVVDLAAGLTDCGHKVGVCTPLTRLPRQLDAEIITVPMRRSLAPIADAGGLVAMAEALRRWQPDIVHAHSSKAGALVRLCRLANTRLPVIYTPHGYAFAGHFSRVEQRVYRALERRLAPLATRVLCVCEAERRLAASIGPANRTRVVHNGIPFPPSLLTGSGGGRAASSAPVLVCMALLRPGKGLETLIDAMAHIVPVCPEVRLHIVGDGPDRPMLRSRAVQSGVERAVQFLPVPENRQEAMQVASVFVHPSWSESFPYAILEAMSLGLPIVATDVGGVGEAIEDGSSGLLVGPRDALGLAQAILALLADPGRAAALAAAARARVGACFTLDRMVEGTRRVYNEVLACDSGAVDHVGQGPTCPSRPRVSGRGRACSLD